mgnify:CR=1 FL=1
MLRLHQLKAVKKLTFELISTDYLRLLQQMIKMASQEKTWNQEVGSTWRLFAESDHLTQMAFILCVISNDSLLGW